MSKWITVLGLLVIASAASAGGPPPVRVAAIGDSLTDEYAEQDYGVHAKCWTQLLVESGRIDMGPTAAQGIPGGNWGEPRRTGYRDNWARYSETTNDAIGSGQHVGASGAGAACVVVFIGGNDFAPWAFGVYDEIYNNRWTQADIDAFIEGRVNNYRAILNVLAWSNNRVILASPPDFNFMPWIWTLRPSISGRNRVQAAMTKMRDRTRQLAYERSAVFLDMFAVTVDLWGPTSAPRQEVLIGGTPVAISGWGTEPGVGFVTDGVHPSTVAQGVWSGVMVSAINTATGAGVPRVTEQEMLAWAGLPDGGAETLGQVLRPHGAYIQDFSCIADFGGDRLVSLGDLFDFLRAYFGNDQKADVDASGLVSIEDVFGYLESYFTGCR